MIDEFLKGMDEYHDTQIKTMNDSIQSIKELGEQRLQNVQNNMMLHTGHSAYRLNEAQKWSSFTIVDPLKLMRIAEDRYVLTTNENQFDFIEIDQTNGFRKIASLDTDNTKVYSACLLNSGMPGLSLNKESLVEVPDKETLILGCNRGFMFKFEREEGQSEWTKKQTLRLE